MFGVPVDAFDLYSLIELAAGTLATMSALIGLFIGYQAYRGLRRNHSEQMRYLSLGMVLLFGVTYGLALVGQSLITVRVLPLFYQDLFRLVVRALQFVGLVFILYSLLLGSRSNPTGQSSD